MHADSTDLIPLKVLIAGGFGVGKTTLVRSLSEIPPLLTEQEMTTASIGVDDADMVPEKHTTTVAMDFGRITVDDSLILYLFGTPGQSRFWFMWDELARGSVGAVVLVDLRRVDDCFPAIDYFENRRLPFVVAINRFPGVGRVRRRDRPRRAGPVRRLPRGLDGRPRRPLEPGDADQPRRARTGPHSRRDLSLRAGQGRCECAASGPVRARAARRALPSDRLERVLDQRDQCRGARRRGARVHADDRACRRARASASRTSSSGKASAAGNAFTATTNGSPRLSK